MGLWLCSAWQIMTQYSMMGYDMVQYDRLLRSAV